MRIGCGPEVITPSKVINTWLLFGLDEPQIMQVQMVRGSGRQIPRARCAWMCFHVSRKCLTPGPLVTSNLGCQRHFLECPVKINMWKEMGGSEGWGGGGSRPSWHLCAAAPLSDNNSHAVKCIQHNMLGKCKGLCFKYDACIK